MSVIRLKVAHKRKSLPHLKRIYLRVSLTKKAKKAGAPFLQRLYTIRYPETRKPFFLISQANQVEEKIYFGSGNKLDFDLFVWEKMRVEKNRVAPSS